MSTITLRSVKGSGLTNNEIDANFTNLNTDKVEAAQTSTLTNKTLALGSNTVSGTTAQFNTALTDGDFATLAGAETLTNKTLTNPSYSGATANGGTVTTIDINGGTIDGTVIGGSSAAAGSFTTLSATGRMTSTDGVFTLGNAYFNVSGTTRGQILTDATNLDLDAKNATHVRLQVATTTVADVTSAGLAVTGALSASGRISATSDTTSPTDGSTYLYKSSAGGVVSGYQVILETGSAGSRTTKATIDVSGNLGLGVTPSAWRTTERGLEVAGSGGSMGALTNTFSETRLYNNTYINTTPACVYKTTGGASMYRQDTAGAHSWYSAASGTAGTTFTFTQLMTLDASGNLGLGVTPDNGKSACLQLKSGISFPATQVASSDANTLDDYEEGTWTPSVGGTATYTARTGSYTKKGREVTLHFDLTINAIGTGSAVDISGVPFANGAANCAGCVSYWVSSATAVVSISAVISPSGSVVNLYGVTAATTTTSAPAIFGSGTRVIGSITYFV